MIFVRLGYFILPEYQGLGLMTEAVKEVIRFAFEDDSVYRIIKNILYLCEDFTGEMTN